MFFPLNLHEAGSLSGTHLQLLRLQLVCAVSEAVVLLPPCSDVVLQDGNQPSGVTVCLLQTVHFFSPLAQGLVQVVSLLSAGHQLGPQLGGLEKHFSFYPKNSMQLITFPFMMKKKN